MSKHELSCSCDLCNDSHKVINEIFKPFLDSDPKQLNYLDTRMKQGGTIISLVYYKVDTINPQDLNRLCMYSYSPS